MFSDYPLVMEQARARRIMSVLGWGPSEVARRYNRLTGAHYDKQQVHKQVSGGRQVSDGLAAFLKLSLRLAGAQRRFARLREHSVSEASVAAAAEFLLRAARAFPELEPDEIARSIVRRARDLDGKD